MSRITISRAKYKFELYEQIPIKLTPYSDGYGRRLYADNHHKTPVKLNISDNASDLIYGKCK